METYKFTYFDLRGLGEPMRLMFKYADVPFEDIRLDCTKWTEMKKTIKWNQLPFLEYNGKMITQSVAISHLLAKKFNQTADDEWKNAKCDEIAGALNDMRILVKPAVVAKFERNPEKHEQIKKELLKRTMPTFLKNLHDILSEVREDKVDGNFIFGEKPVWADFWLAHFTETWTLLFEDPNFLDEYPLLEKQQREVYNLPKIKNWLAIRPQTMI